MEGFNDVPSTPRKPPGECFYCDKPSAYVIELRVSEKPARGQRGKTVRTVTRRCCVRHARAYFDLAYGKPLDDLPGSERRTGFDRRTS